MSFSLYYDARRDHPLTEYEITKSNELIDFFCKKFPLKGEAEEFCVYPGNDEKSIFYGSTKIPDYSEEAFFVAYQHWISLLYEIHYIIKDCDWSVNFDDTELIWTNEGWRFPEEQDAGE